MWRVWQVYTATCSGHAQCMFVVRYAVYTLISKYHAFISTTVQGGNFMCTSCGGNSDSWTSCTSEPAGEVCSGAAGSTYDDVSPQCTSSDDLKIWMIVLIVLAGVAVLAAGIGAIVWICRARAKIRQRAAHQSANYVVHPDARVRWNVEPASSQPQAKPQRSANRSANRSRRSSIPQYTWETR